MDRIRCVAHPSPRHFEELETCRRRRTPHVHRWAVRPVVSHPHRRLQWVETDPGSRETIAMASSSRGSGETAHRSSIRLAAAAAAHRRGPRRSHRCSRASTAAPGPGSSGHRHTHRSGAVHIRRGSSPGRPCRGGWPSPRSLGKASPPCVVVSTTHADQGGSMHRVGNCSDHALSQRIAGWDGNRRMRSTTNPLVAGSSSARPTNTR